MKVRTITQVLDAAGQVVTEVSSDLPFNCTSPPPPPPPPPSGPGWAPAGYFAPSVKPLELVGPNPMTPASDSWWHWAEPNQEYVRPFVPRGGAKPYRFRLIEGPPGMTLGDGIERLPSGRLGRPVDAGILRWDAGMLGEQHTITIEYEDQERTLRTESWMVTVADRFIRKLPAEPFTGTGPFGIDEDEIVNEDKWLVLESGTHILDGFSANNGNLSIKNGRKVLGIIGEGGVVIDESNGFLRFGGGNPDFVLWNVTLADNDTSDEVGRMILNSNGNSDRMFFGRVDFAQYFKGTNSGNNNPAAYYASNAPSNWNEHVFWECDIHGEMGTMLQLYAQYKLTIHHCSGTASPNQGDGSSRGLIYLKQEMGDVEIYDLDWSKIDSTNWPLSGLLSVGGAADQSNISIDHIRIKDNRTGLGNRDGAFFGFMSGTATNFYGRRWTIEGRVRWDIDAQNVQGDAVLDGCLIHEVTGNPPPQLTGTNVIDPALQFDADLNLVDDTDRGKIGAEHYW